MGGSFTPTEFDHIAQTIPNFNELKVFVETGTHQGDTTRIVSPLFEEVHTFEINKIFYEFSKNKLAKLNCTNVKHYLGDSVLLLDDILHDDFRSTFFFLDAHHHFMQTIEDIKMNNGSNQTPLMDELRIINNKYPTIFGVICIDDVRLWRSSNSDWSNVNELNILSSLCNHQISDSFEFNDRLYIVLNSRKIEEIEN